jgi:serine/threonine protein kinase
LHSAFAVVGDPAGDSVVVLVLHVVVVALLLLLMPLLALWMLGLSILLVVLPVVLLLLLLVLPVLFWRWVELPIAAVVAVMSAFPRMAALLQPGEWLRVADLQMGELLGSGGFGAVHRGRLRGEDVAIKKLHIEGSGQMSASQKAEFQEEVVHLQALRHPRIIRFIGVAVEPPLLCIVTELAAGGSLESLLHAQRVPIPDSRRRVLILQIIEGVAFLHSRQPPCVHRDLKSANVVLDVEFCAKICDFGLTESMDKTQFDRWEIECGSPRYMAPELFDARHRLTEKLDIWSLGCLIVEVLVERWPNEDCTTRQQVAAKLVVERRGPFDNGWANGLNAGVQQIVDSCFDWYQFSRPAAVVLLESLGRFESFAKARSKNKIPNDF